MRDLLASLRDSDASLYPVLAQRWRVNVANLSTLETAQALADAMQDGSLAAGVYDSLDDAARGALQALVGTKDAKMPKAMFTRMYGDIRKPARGIIEREKPHQQPKGPAEALFYRGLVYENYEQAATGARAVLYVPPELLAALPTHRTAYDDLPDVPLPAEGGRVDAGAGPLPDDDLPRLEALDDEDVDAVRPADTSAVDDLLTLLAYVQNNGLALDRGVLPAAFVEAVMAHLLVRDPVRLAFLFEVGIGAGLLAVEEGEAAVQREQARRWLQASRGQQVRALAEAWRVSQLYRELWHVPGLHPEPTGWPYDPAVARAALVGFLRDVVPHEAWWSLDELIVTVKETDPDFQRPNGDYESWYIRNDAGDYLHGFESWDAVEGALLEFYVDGPLHWLGLVDLADDAARLTAYGRAFVDERANWPDPAVTPEPISIAADGTLTASRRAASLDRFQLARFTSWVSPATRDGSAPYTYRLTAQGIQQAAQQGIETTHIAGFINRVLGDSPMPRAIEALLAKWQGGAASAGSATLERLLVLRTTSQAMLDRIVEKPALRRYLGARLGPMAVTVRADQWEALQDALAEEGIDLRQVDS